MVFQRGVGIGDVVRQCRSGCLGGLPSIYSSHREEKISICGWSLLFQPCKGKYDCGDRGVERKVRSYGTDTEVTHKTRKLRKKKRPRDSRGNESD